MKKLVNNPEQQLAEIQEYCEKAIPAPWYYSNKSETGSPKGFVFTDDEVCITPVVALWKHSGVKKNNGEFIARSRTDLPRLVAYVKKLREALKHYEDAKKWSLNQWTSGASIWQWYDSTPKELHPNRFAKQALEEPIV